MRKVKIIESENRHFHVQLRRGRKVAAGRWKWQIQMVVADGAPLTLREARAVVERMKESLTAQGCTVDAITFQE